ncbi:hypothetical protein [Kitasatospora kifunensis]
MADEARPVMPLLRQARAAVDALESALLDQEVDLSDLSVGFRVVPVGVILVQLRPLLPTELLLLAEALHS